MITVYVDRRGSRIDSRGGRLYVEAPGAREGNLPLKVIERVVLTTAVDVTGRALAGLAAEGVPAVILGARTQEAVAFVLGPAHKDATIRLGQALRAQDPSWCLRWARRFVRAKIRREQRWIRNALAAVPAKRYRLTGALRDLETCLGGIEEPAGLDALRGLEGAAARAGFDALAALVPSDLRFNGRVRRPPPDPVNAALSLGATLLHFDAVRAAYGAGLDPFIGFYHQPAYGRASLACDLVEPTRPELNRWVWRLFADRELRPSHFGRTGDGVRLTKEGRAVFYPAYERLGRPLRRMLRRMAYGIARAVASDA
ncbi:MAG: CRISPR-associated endonuclease Cas1 [Deltaproteobacteria bacterium]|nr:MAG: CRISPR-associated endonuclease Cas1 [Deltaproteobacteria bacterium]